MSVLNGVIVETDHFIREVESRPGLWFTHSPDYQNREQRKKLWEDIAKKYQPKWDSYDVGQKQIRVDAMISKWRNIRDSYMKDRKRRYKLTSTGRPKRKYGYYDKLLFLEKNYAPIEDILGGEPVDDHQFSEVNIKNEVDCEETFFEGDAPLNMDSEPFDQTPSNIADHNGDQLFLLSLLPFMSKLTEQQNMEFRIKVMNLYHDIKYSN